MPAAFHTLNALQLPRGMVWIDELSWLATERAVATSITGAVLMDVGVRTAGRPITLQGESDQGWIRRATLLELLELANVVPVVPLTFTHADGREFQVQFAPGVDPITASPLRRPELPQGTYPYVATVRLITV